MKSEVDQALENFETAAGHLCDALKLFPSGEHHNPDEVEIATKAPRMAVEQAKARLDVTLAVVRDKSSSRTACAMVVFTGAITLATIVQGWVGWLNYETAKTPKPVVCTETKK
jgi:hypothetical protein